MGEQNGLWVAQTVVDLYVCCTIGYRIVEYIYEIELLDITYLTKHNGESGFVACFLRSSHSFASHSLFHKHTLCRESTRTYALLHLSLYV